jgi:hypothetical protein
VISLGRVPAATAETELAISGNVSRVPAKETEIVLTSSGGTSPTSDTASMDGSFTIRVSLVTNVLNTIVLTAQDGTGSVSSPVTVEVRQDAVPPTVASTTPTGAEVSTAPTLAVTFSEPVVLEGTDAVELGNAVHTAQTSALLSGDSLTVTLGLTSVLFENAVYRFTFPGVTDVAGNAVTPSGTACFVTANSGLAAADETDPADDLFLVGSPAGTSPADVDFVRLSIHSSRLFGVLRFTTPRSFGSVDSANNAFAYVDLDLDQDSTTGFVTLKDTVFAGDPGLSSGIRVEYVIGVDWFPQFADSAVVGQYVEAGGFQTSFRFLPDVCGRHLGFAVPMAQLGGDDGNFDYVILAGNVEPAGDLVIDPVPESGHHTVAFAGVAAPVLTGLDTIAPSRVGVLRWFRLRPFR